MAEIKASFEREAARVNLRKMLEGKKRGDHITAAEVVDATGFPNWSSFGDTIRRWARASGFVIFAVTGDGWRLGLADDHVVYAESKRKAARRRLHQGRDAIVAAPVAELSEHGMRQVVFSGQRITHQAAVADSHDKEIRREFKLGAERVPLRIVAADED